MVGDVVDALQGSFLTWIGDLCLFGSGTWSAVVKVNAIKTGVLFWLYVVIHGYWKEEVGLHKRGEDFMGKCV
jgi:hypothetical protein